ncbi:IPExxxVDY family protein [Flavobacterium sp. DG1-102-2]|uniref:IPExxxVDY family protein n=1 Tax=Flavobacterium sp. DG1-102-2 TaxID=3081663 RepID=UPI002948FF0A|nr:IPExxxVDY family protein [Flavobacterium sp. DG1-102-2]MDV6169625.1 IPExxxVDY family protein [Flavobacterium sp. DG1-102-2]
MAIHKLLIDDFVTVDYKLIAIHSSLEDHRLAYFINRELAILLEKCPNDIWVTINEGESCFSRFIFEDPGNDSAWNLIQNRNRITTMQSTTTTSLFEDTGLSIETSVFLMPELKTVDYVLKIENTPTLFEQDKVVEKLLSIKQIATAYSVDHKKLKSKNNLIF